MKLIILILIPISVLAGEITVSFKTVEYTIPCEGNIHSCLPDALRINLNHKANIFSEYFGPKELLKLKRLLS